MKLPSFQYLVLESTATLKRFPFAIINVFIGTFVAVCLIDVPYDQQDSYPTLLKLLMVTGLGISLFTALVVLAEKKKLTPIPALAMQGVGALILVAYYFSLPATLKDAPTFHFIRFALFVLGLHLLVAIAPFTGKGEINGFWQYNRALFLKFLTAALFSAVLYGGLCVALVAADKLLGMNIDGKRYAQLWAVMVGIFNTWFFLSGVPKDLDALEHQTEYPKGLKVFTQFVLIPLVTIYLFILYLYTGKIIIEWQWPNGWVANLILGFSIAGIFSLLLVYPIKDRIENVWFRFFSRWYYVALVPLVILLALSIWLRVSEYGITENRYFVIILGAWLAWVVMYMLTAKSQNIKLIPMTLCGLAFLTSFGPWGAFDVSQTMQLQRLESLLAKNNLLVNGKVHRATEVVSFQNTKDICSITRYIVSTHGCADIQSLFDQNLQDYANRFGGKDVAINTSDVVTLMGLKYVEWEGASGESFSFNASKPEGLSIVGYDHFLHVEHNRHDISKLENIDVDAIQYRVGLRPESSALIISRSDVLDDSLVIDLGPLIKTLGERYTSQHNNNIPAKEMRVEQGSRLLRAIVSVHSFGGSARGETPETRTITADILVGKK